MTASAAQRARSPRVMFALVIVAILISSMQFSMISVALPELISGLHAPLRWAGWTITIFTLAQAISMPIAGRLSDDFGRRTVFMGGFGVFAAASALCALAPNIWILILGRAIQGLAAGTIQPSAYGIVGDAFGVRNVRAIGVLSSVGPIGSIIGPNIGGLIVEHLGWRWTFALNLPAGIAVVLAGRWLLARSPRRTASGPTDFLGAALLGGAVLPFVFALTELSRGAGEGGVSLPLVLVPLAASVLLLGLLIRRETRIAKPFLDLDLLRRREFIYVNVLQFNMGVALFGAFSFVPLYAREAYGMSSTASGTLLTPRAIALVLVSLAVAGLLPRTGYRRPIIAGLLIMSAGLAALSLGLHDVHLFGLGISNFVYLAIIIAVAGLGVGMANPPANNAAIELAPERLASIAGLRGMFRFLGGVLGTSVIVLIASRASSTAAGIEIAFLFLAGVGLLTAILALRIPEMHAAVVPVEERRP